MPAPNPHELWIEEEGPERPVVSFLNYFWTNNRGNRKARAIAMAKRLSRRDWACKLCGDPIADFKRVDARYCRETCRKKAARLRQELAL